jgi:hypothetical protein
MRGSPFKNLCVWELSAADEDDADRAADLDDLAGRREAPGRRVDAKGHDRVGILVGGVEEVGRGVRAQEAGCLALGRLPADRDVRMPWALSTAKIAMLSCARLRLS